MPTRLLLGEQIQQSPRAFCEFRDWGGGQVTEVKMCRKPLASSPLLGEPHTY